MNYSSAAPYAGASPPMTMEDVERAVKRYKELIPNQNAFVFHATRKHLKALGLKDGQVIKIDGADVMMVAHD